jgi:hypothetical protein
VVAKLRERISVSKQARPYKEEMELNKEKKMKSEHAV